MKNAILIHGMPDKAEFYDPKTPSLSNSHWFPWLQKELSIRDYAVQTPEMPKAFKPDYEVWKKIISPFEINDESALVGHSCGGGFLLRFLSEEKIKIDKLILVAPWLDPNKEETTDFFEFEFDLELARRAKEVHLFYSTDDGEDILTSVSQVKTWLPTAIIHEFTSKGHFCENDLHGKVFPELLEVTIA